jgi:glycerol-3-phosphate O-acyltransferase
MGTIARRTGIIHVRRSTADVPIYRLALRSFVGQLVANRANLCWAIEGGRTRTGKLRPPRYGLLRYVADATEELPEADPLLVPVSIMYDQLPVHEAGKMASEARGQDKQPEDVGWLVRYASGLRQRLGRVYVDFGTPLPLRERLAELRGEQVTENQVERVALEVCHRLNEATPITPTAAVCVALLAAGRALTLDQMLDTIRPLAEYVVGRGWPVAGGAVLTDRSTLRWALRALVQSGVLTCYTGTETVWRIGPDRHLIAAMYRNSAIHVLLSRAIAELAVQAVAAASATSSPDAPTRAPRSVMLEEALRLRELLKFDFFFAGREQFSADVTAEIDGLARSDGCTGVDITPSRARGWLARARPLVAHLVLRPFIDAYRVVADQLASLDDDETARTAPLTQACLRLGHQWALQGRLASEESVSAEMFGTALKLAAHRDLLTPTAPLLAKRRRDFADELASTAAAIGAIADLAQSRAG